MTRNQRDYIVHDLVVPAILLIASIVVVLFLVATITPKPAKAHCPPGTSYGCIRDYDGKQVCGCH